jgi:hypothetical protein
MQSIWILFNISNLTRKHTLQSDTWLMSVILCGERIMRNLWELDISTVVLNDLQAEFGTALATEDGRRQNSTQLLFLSCLWELLFHLLVYHWI